MCITGHSIMNWYNEFLLRVTFTRLNPPCIGKAFQKNMCSKQAVADILFSWKRARCFCGQTHRKAWEFKRKLWAGPIQWEKNHHQTACSSWHGTDLLRKTAGWPWAPDMRIFTEVVAPGSVTVWGGRPSSFYEIPEVTSSAGLWQVLQQNPEGAAPSGFAMQEVSARKDVALGTAVLLCRSLLGRAGGFAVRERCKGGQEGWRGQQDGDTPGGWGFPHGQRAGGSTRPQSEIIHVFKQMRSFKCLRRCIVLIAI